MYEVTNHFQQIDTTHQSELLVYGGNYLQEHTSRKKGREFTGIYIGYCDGLVEEWVDGWMDDVLYFPNVPFEINIEKKIKRIINN